MIIDFTVNRQILHKQSNPCLANDSQNYLALSFTFDSSWEDYEKYAIFTYKGKHYQTLLEYDNEEEAYVQIVPKEVLVGKGFYFTLYGTYEDERITTNQLRIDLLESGYTTDISSIDYPDVPDVFQPIYHRLDVLENDMLDKIELPDVEREVKKGLNTLYRKIRIGE